VLERVARAHRPREDEAEELGAGAASHLVRGARGWGAVELTREPKLVDVPIAGQEHDAIGLCTLRLEEGRDDLAAGGPAIDRVPAEHEHGVIANVQPQSFVVADEGCARAELEELVPATLDVREVRHLPHPRHHLPTTASETVHPRA
jgi:hypothetical protein